MPSPGCLWPLSQNESTRKTINRFSYEQRVRSAHGKFKNSNAKFRLRITTFSTYISNYDRT